MDAPGGWEWLQADHAGQEVHVEMTKKPEASATLQNSFATSDER